MGRGKNKKILRKGEISHIKLQSENKKKDEEILNCYLELKFFIDSRAYSRIVSLPATRENLSDPRFSNKSPNRAQSFMNAPF